MKFYVCIRSASRFIVSCATVLFPYTRDRPDDQTTFQGYAGSDPVDIPPQRPASSYIGHGNNPANMQTSLPHTRGYDGLPVPSV